MRCFRKNIRICIAVFKKKVIAASNSFNDMRERAKRISEHFVISQMIGEPRVL